MSTCQFCQKRASLTAMTAMTRHGVAAPGGRSEQATVPLLWDLVNARRSWVSVGAIVREPTAPPEMTRGPSAPTGQRSHVDAAVLDTFQIHRQRAGGLACKTLVDACHDERAWRCTAAIAPCRIPSLGPG